MERLSTTAVLAEAESVMHVPPTESLYQSEAGVRRLCACATAALENHQQSRFSRNLRVT